MRKSDRTRQIILEKTAPIFNVKGYAGTSVADMTEATGLTKGSVYGNFANKEEVALAAFEHNWQRVQAAMRGQMEGCDSSRDKLLAMLEVFQDPRAHGFPEGGCPLLNTAIEADDTHPALREKAAAAFLAWKRNLVDVIGAGIAAKEFRKQVDAEQAAVTLIALIEGGVMMSRLMGSPRYRKSLKPALEKVIDGLG